MNWKIVIVLLLLVCILNPQIIPLVFMLLPYVFLFRILSERHKKLAEMMSICLKQKHLAQQTELTGPMTLLGILAEITEKAKPTKENLSTLVNFGCRLSLSNLRGLVIINLDDPDTN